MRQRLMRMLLLAGIGFVARQIQKKLQQGNDAPAANPTAAPFETHLEGDSVQYEATNPVERDPKDPDEPFGGAPLR